MRNPFWSKVISRSRFVMEYQKTKKPYLQPKKIGKGTKTRRKDAKMLQAREIEHQLPSSKRGNRKEFFKGMDQ